MEVVLVGISCLLGCLFTLALAFGFERCVGALNSTEGALMLRAVSDRNYLSFVLTLSH